MQEASISTSVLVIGGGGAGLRAALEARKCGADVLLASKMAPHAPSSTALAAGWFTYCTDALREDIFKELVEEGGYLNDQRLIEIFVQEVGRRIPELQNFEVHLQVGENPQERNFGRIATEFKCSSAGEPPGFGLTRPLRATAQKMGVKFLDNVMVTKLVRFNDSVSGALGVDLVTQEFIHIVCKAVVLATGGASCIYARTDNPPGTSGDGFALAYEAGAELLDMEFVTFSLPNWRLHEIFQTKDPTDESLLDRGSAHYFCGGIKIDEECRTTVRGLFAAGEVTGGLFGAARLGGSALADTIVFGARAGEKAVLWTQENELAELNLEQVSEEKARLQAIVSQRKGRSPHLLQERLRSLMWRYAGIIRTESSLHKALDALEEVAEQILELRVTNAEELRLALEVPNMLATARMVVTASLMRTESRGGHWRLDYPRPDNHRWLKNIIIYHDRDGMKTRLQAPVMTMLRRSSMPQVGTAWSGYLVKQR